MYLLTYLHTHTPTTRKKSYWLLNYTHKQAEGNEAESQSGATKAAIQAVAATLGFSLGIDLDALIGGAGAHGSDGGVEAASELVSLLVGDYSGI